MQATDPRWPKVLSLSVHEFRTPVTVVAGYIRMLLTDRAGALNDQQRRLLQEAEKSCGRLSALLVEVSELSNLEAGTSPLKKSTIDLHTALREAVEKLLPLPDRDVPVHLELADEPATIDADPARLVQALGSIIAGLRREVVGEEGLTIRERHAGDAHEILIGDGATLAALENETGSPSAVFDEWRGGVGLSLAVARRILNAHDAAIYAPPEARKSGARIVLRSV
jgi:K+-sensing histidine kinase KdpD